MEVEEGEDVIKEGGEKAGEGYKEGVSVALSKRNNISQTNSAFLEGTQMGGNIGNIGNQKNAMF